MGQWDRLAWQLALPAAAECVVSIWLPEMSARGVDLKILFLNVSGALLEGFFAALNGRVALQGTLGLAVASLSGAIRASFLSAYTSWAGMVGYSGQLAHEYGSIYAGALYMVISLALGIVAYVLGGVVASACASERPAAVEKGNAVHSTRLALLGAVCAFLVASYVGVKTQMAAFDEAFVVDEDEGLPALIKVLDDESNQLLVGIASAIGGAAVGNALGDYVDSIQGSGSVGVPLGTLTCNTLFALLGLAHPIASIRRKALSRSVLITSFSGSFCGAASAFAGHCSEVCELWRSVGRRKAVKNLAWNLLAAAVVCMLASKLEQMHDQRSTIDFNGNGVVEAFEVAVYFQFAPPPPTTTPRRKFLGVF
ncbi:hypothetical protein AB1Y20_001381 [Prymnesium parvum]|uniref:Solute carrier family 40 protein n=1 Tax=Prymnesium parvum TaxID=97485 RepID=A0AB34J8V5_PRYPA